MLRWRKDTVVTDNNVKSAADAVVTLDLPEDKYMLKLSAASFKLDGGEVVSNSSRPQTHLSLIHI